jgi:muramoyltetrapeptide carboxypeptidase
LAILKRIKPRALRRGDAVAIVAPASNIQRDLLEYGCEALRAFGYNPVFEESIVERDLYFAGPVERRARELQEMFAREDVKAIVCARGGYGTNYLLDALDVKVVAAHPKIFVGYSDVTTLLTHFLDAGGLVTFHGPMVTKDFANPDGVDLDSWEAALGGANEWVVETGAGSGVNGLRDGVGEGILYGGCLSMLVASLGTPYEIRTEGTILFLEDVAAKPFQVDRMLMQMKLAGKFTDVRGIVFGEMIDCVQAANQDYTLEEVAMRVVGDLGVPVAYGLRSGHVTRGNVTLPLGVRSSLEVQGTKVVLKILEAAVES